MSRAIFQIPVEVWSLIFTECLSDDRFSKPNPAKAPLLFCGVTSYWRNVAISTPRLWTSLDILRMEEGFFPRAPLIFLWLERSRPMPLSIRYGGRPKIGFEIPSCPTSMEVARRIIGTMQRWKHLSLWVPHLDDASLNLFFGGAAPLLRTVKLEGYSFTSIDRRLPFIWWKSPLLLSFEVIGTPTRGLNFVQSYAIPFRQLTHLDMTSQKFHVSHVFRILESAAPSLEWCAFRNIYGTAAKSDSITLPELSDLHLEGKRLRDLSVDGVLKAIVAPVLSTLTLVDVSFVSVPFLLSESLSKLILVRVDIEGMNILPLLQTLPMLEVLRTDDVPDHMYRRAYLDSEVLEALVAFNHNAKEFAVCPRLRELVVPKSMVAAHDYTDKGNRPWSGEPTKWNLRRFHDLSASEIMGGVCYRNSDAD